MSCVLTTLFYVESTFVKGGDVVKSVYVVLVRLPWGQPLEVARILFYICLLPELM